MSSPEPGARTGAAQDPPKRSFRRRFAVWWLSEIMYFSFSGAVLATLMMWLSTTPSLLPRGPLFQGIVTGFSGAAGYALGTFGAYLARYLVSRDDPWPRPKDTWWAALAAVTGAGLAVMLYFYSRWQDQVRDLMGVPRLDWTTYPIIAATAMIVYAVLMVAGQLWGAGVRSLSRWLRKRVPPRIAALTSGFVMVVLTVFIINGAVADYGMRALDNTFSSLNGETTPASSPPMSPLRSGGPDSLVTWPSLGLTGRAFVGTGPTVEELTAFNDAPATEPIRVYAGVESSDNPRANADLVARELERTGAFDRKVLGVGFSTGTGWMNHATVDSLEYMYNGDTAIASMQYSVLPSWISFLVDTERARQAGVALFEAIDRRVREIPEAERPKVVVFGESLGAYGAEAPFGSVQTLAARTDGAFLTGPTFSNTLWNDLTGNRDPGSPQWLPIYENGEQVRFIAEPADLNRPAGQSWDDVRIVYLQHPSDPVSWWSPRHALNRPDWLREQRGRDVLPAMQWIPIITFLQLTTDLAVAGEAPDGHGHTYLSAIPHAWDAILHPPGWTPEKSRRLIPLLRRE